MDKFDLLCLIEAISNFAYDIHYTANGRNFYSDHLFSERLADIDVKDDFIETFYLGESEDAPDSAKISAKVAEITPKPSQDTQADFKKLRKMIVKALMAIENYHGTKGEEDLLGSLAHILQRHNGLLFRELAYTAEEIKNDNDEWERLITGDDVLGGELNNEKWITVHPNKENPDDYRRLKVEDGETSEEAVERKYGKDKKDKEPEKDDKKDKEEKKETEEKKDTESGEEDLTKLSDDELEKKIEEIGDAQLNLYKKQTQYVEEKQAPAKKEIAALWDEAMDAYHGGDGKKYINLKSKIDELEYKLRAEEQQLEDEFNLKNKEEKFRLSEEKAKYMNEQSRRYREKVERSEKKQKDLLERIDKLMTADLSDEEFDKEYNAIKEEAKNSDMEIYHKNTVINTLSMRADSQRFETKVKRIPSKVENYKEKTEKFIKQLENTELPSETHQKDEENRKKRLEELREAREKAPTKEEADKIDSQITDIVFSHWAESNSKNNIIAENVRFVSQMLKNNFGDTGKEIETAKTSKGSVGDMHYKTIREALSGVVGEKINVSNPPKILGMRGRAHFSSFKREIKLEKNDSAGVAIHEYTHFLEANNPKMIDNSIAFLEYRTKGEKTQFLRKLTGISYGDSEVARPDKFFNPYCGKMYSSGDSYKSAYATELMSMGVQRLFEDPKGFAKEDREYFDFVIANLRGEL